ncbi:MAG TPA: hypothetical protein VN493_05245 [Thermoanaerobaculia bacterium]|nr:hypothetical protein [Thermoanaerobaculia bacterium]
MSLKEYTNNTWRVKSAGPLSTCKPGDQINFSGVPDKVSIYRNKVIAYQDGRYHEITNTIKRENDYVIMMIGEFPQLITFNQQDSDSDDGSWTAEDQTPAAGGG